jgi:hypothetical protein
MSVLTENNPEEAQTKPQPSKTGPSAYLRKGPVPKIMLNIY